MAFKRSAVRLPRCVLIRRIFYTRILQPIDHGVQTTVPEFLEPSSLTKPLHDRGADGVVSADECAAGQRFGQCIIPEAAQRPDLWAVIGAVDTGCNIASAGITVVVAAEETGITATGSVALTVVMIIAAKETGIGVSGFSPVAVIVIVPTE